jgi:hypothetical protein
VTPSIARTVIVPADGQPTLARLSGALAWPLHSPGDALDYSADFSAWLAPADQLTDASVSVSPGSGLLIGWTQRTSSAVTVLLAGGAVGAQLVTVAATTASGLRKAIDISLPVFGQAVAASTAPDVAPDQLLTAWGAPRLTTAGQPIIVS